MLLHALMDWQPWPAAASLVWMLAIGALGVGARRILFRRANLEEAQAVLALRREVIDGSNQPGARLRCGVCGQSGLPGARHCESAADC